MTTSNMPYMPYERRVSALREAVKLGLADGFTEADHVVNAARQFDAFLAGLDAPAEPVTAEPVTVDDAQTGPFKVCDEAICGLPEPHIVKADTGVFPTDLWNVRFTNAAGAQTMCNYLNAQAQR